MYTSKYGVCTKYSVSMGNAARSNAAKELIGKIPIRSRPWCDLVGC